MCYNTASLAYQKLKYARRMGSNPEEIEKLEKEYRRLKEINDPLFFANAFTFPEIPVHTDKEPHQPQMYQWGLVPFFIKDEKGVKSIQKKTLNCRSETMFEKPSFKFSARGKRCLVVVDGFFEYHHHKGKTYPFFIRMKNGDPMVFGGLWNEWVNKETGEVLPTFTIVTTKANAVMEVLHNNPKREEARMPVIIPKELDAEWLARDEDAALAKERVQALTLPFPSDQLEYISVNKLTGKYGVGNNPIAQEKKPYEELEAFYNKIEELAAGK